MKPLQGPSIIGKMQMSPAAKKVELEVNCDLNIPRSSTIRRIDTNRNNFNNFNLNKKLTIQSVERFNLALNFTM